MEPRSIAGYTIEGLLGRGSTATVYRARDEKLDRPVAVKLLRDVLDHDARARFMVEARAAGRIIHPNVVQVFSVGEHEGRTFIVQELVDGHPLSDLLEARGRLSPAAVIDIGVQAAEALERAVEAGVLHRDVKPGNLLVNDRGVVKLADFGLAKITHAPSGLTERGETLGTPHYMSPEQGRAEDLDARSDQYSLGATLYHLVTGAPVFDAPSTLALLNKHATDPVVPVLERVPECPPALAAVIERMLEKRREDRFESFAEVIEALDSARSEVEGEELEGDVVDLVGSDQDRDPDRAESDPGPAPSLEPRVHDARPFLVAALAGAALLLLIVSTEAVGKRDKSRVRPPPGPPVHPVVVRSNATPPALPGFRMPGQSSDGRPNPNATAEPAPLLAGWSALSPFEKLLLELDGDPSDAATAARQLGRLRDHTATLHLVRLLDAKHPALAVAAADALGDLGDIRAIKPLEAVARTATDPKLRAAARRSHGRLYSVDGASGEGESSSISSR